MLLTGQSLVTLLVLAARMIARKALGTLTKLAAELSPGTIAVSLTGTISGQHPVRGLTAEGQRVAVAPCRTGGGGDDTRLVNDVSGALSRPTVSRNTGCMLYALGTHG